MPTSHWSYITKIVNAIKTHNPKSILEIGCVKGTTLVVTSTGPKHIKDIVKGDLVLTHTGEYRPVIQTFKRHYNGDIYKLSMNSEELYITEEHPIYGFFSKDCVYNQNFYCHAFCKNGCKHKPNTINEWIEPNALSNKFFTAYPKIKLSNQKPIVFLNYQKDTYYNNIEKNIALDLFKKDMLQKTIAKITGISKSTLYRWFNFNTKKVKSSFKNGLLKTVKNTKIELTPDFARLIGYWIAEGSAKTGEVCFSFNSKGDLPYIEDVKSITKTLFNCDAVLTPRNNNIISVVIYNSALARFFKTIGNRSYNKKIPNIILSANKTILENLIKGMWRGDGCIETTRFAYTTTSKMLAFQLKEILNKLDIFGAITKGKRDYHSLIPRKHEPLQVRVGSLDLEKMSNILGVIHPFLNVRRTVAPNVFKDSKFFYKRITKIEKVHYSGFVYNLSVENDNSYCTPNFCLHNCGFGKYGILSREYLEIYGANRWQKKDWQVKIDGVEIYKPYITEQIKYYYDTIYNADIVTLFKENKLSNYDLILMTDVLEHLSKEDGLFVFNEILKHSKFAIFAVPLGDWRYIFDGDNKNESHISTWEYKEFIHHNLKDSKTYPVSGKKIGVFIYENK